MLKRAAALICLLAIVVFLYAPIAIASVPNDPSRMTYNQWRERKQLRAQAERYLRELNSENEGIVIRAVDKLSRLRAKEAIPALAVLYRYGNSEEISLEILDAFGALVAADSREVLREALTHTSAKVRACALRSIAMHGFVDGVDAAFKLADDPAGGVRQVVRRILTASGLDYGYEIDPDNPYAGLLRKVREWWSKNRGEKPSAYASALAFARKERITPLALSVLRAIRAGGIVGVFDEVCGAASAREDTPARNLAREVAAELTLKDFGFENESRALAALEEYRKSGAWAAERTLLESAAADADAKNRMIVAGRLERIEEPWAGDLLFRLLGDESAGVRAKAWQVLSWRYPGTVPKFDPDAGADGRKQRLEAIEEWRRFAFSSDVGLLEVALEHRMPEVRARAVRSLGGLDWKKGCDAAFETCVDESIIARKAAAREFLKAGLEFGFVANLEPREARALVEPVKAWWAGNRAKTRGEIFASILAFARKTGNKTMLDGALETIKRETLPASLSGVYELAVERDGGYAAGAAAVFEAVVLRDFGFGDAKEDADVRKARGRLEKYYESGVWRTTASILASALSDSDDLNRLAAIARLTLYDAPWATDLAVSTLGDESYEVREEAYSVLEWRFPGEVPAFSPGADEETKKTQGDAVLEWWRLKLRDK